MVEAIVDEPEEALTAVERALDARPGRGGADRRQLRLRARAGARDALRAAEPEPPRPPASDGRGGARVHRRRPRVRARAPLSRRGGGRRRREGGGATGCSPRATRCTRTPTRRPPSTAGACSRTSATTPGRRAARRGWSSPRRSSRPARSRTAAPPSPRRRATPARCATPRCSPPRRSASPSGSSTASSTTRRWSCSRTPSPRCPPTTTRCAHRCSACSRRGSTPRPSPSGASGCWPRRWRWRGGSATRRRSRACCAGCPTSPRRPSASASGCPPSAESVRLADARAAPSAGSGVTSTASRTCSSWGRSRRPTASCRRACGSRTSCATAGSPGTRRCSRGRARCSPAGWPRASGSSRAPGASGCGSTRASTRRMRRSG